MATATAYKPPSQSEWAALMDKALSKATPGSKAAAQAPVVQKALTTNFGYVPNEPITANQLTGAGGNVLPGAIAPISTPTYTPQQQAQNWINDPASGFKGMTDYTTGQQNRYNDAVLGNNADLVSKLLADADRVGYTLTAPEKKVINPTVPPVGTPPVGGGSPSGGGGYGGPPASQPFNPAPQMTTNDPNFMNKTIQDIINILSPATNQTKRNLNTNYDLARQRALETLNSRGVYYGDFGKKELDLQEGQRQQALTDVDAQTQAQALAKALEFAQLPMQERQMLFNEWAQAKGLNLQEGGLMGQYGGAQTMAAKNADRNFGLQEGQLTGIYGNNPTLQAQMALGSIGGQPTLEAQGLAQQKELALLPYDRGMTKYQQAGLDQNKELALLPYDNMTKYQEATINQSASETRAKAVNDKISRMMDQVKAFGSVYSQEQADVLGVPIGTPTQAANDAAEQRRIGWANNAVAGQNANTSASNAKMNRIMNEVKTFGKVYTKEQADTLGVPIGTPTQDVISGNQSLETEALRWAASVNGLGEEVYDGSNFSLRTLDPKTQEKIMRDVEFYKSVAAGI